MPLYQDPWAPDKSGERVAKIARSLSQDVGRKFKKSVIATIFPSKKIRYKKTGKIVDIGKSCQDWTYNILTNFADDNELQTRLIHFIIFAYKNNIDIDNDRNWLEYIATNGITSFSALLAKFPNISRLAFMGELEKPKYTQGRDVKTVRW